VAPVEVSVAVCLALLIGSVTDLRSRVIPDLVTIPAAVAVVAGLVLAAPFPSGLGAGLLTATMICLPLGALSVLRPGSFGMGDVKLIAVMALAAGPAVWVPLVPGFGIAAGYGLVKSGRDGTGVARTTLPLAPFLAIPGVAFFAWPALSGPLLQ
jgi:prepilin signal peptidase PulO-like enzyme (type II secretory pathway)